MFKHLIDVHMHIESRKWEDFELMAMAGIKAIIAVIDPTDPCEFNRIVNDQVDRWGMAKRNFIEVYTACGLNPFLIPADYKSILRKLPKYIEDKKIVAIGEVGLDPNSEVRLPKQEESLEYELEIAKEYNIPVMFHTPFKEKYKYTERDLKLVEKVGLDADKVIIDHGDNTIPELVLNFGANLAITVQPWRRLTPSDAADIIEEVGVERVMVSSDCGGGPSDPLAVPKTALELKRRGMAEDEIKKVLYENPINAYRLPLPV